MRLSYSSYRTYLQCPKLYYNQANKIKAPEKSSSYFALYGKLIESFFKRYTNVLCKQNIVMDDEKIEKILRNQWEYILENNYVNWEDPWVSESSEQIYRNVFSDVKKNLEKFDFWKVSSSEVNMEIILKKSQDILSCRLDFIVDKSDGTTEILDGKGTNKIDKNVDIEQLYFYSLMYLLRKGKLPDKIGFLYYRYQLIKYIEFDLKTIMDFKDKLALVKRKIREDKSFEAIVGLSKQCKWCAYKMTCNAFIGVKNAKLENRPKIDQLENNDGITFFSPRG